MSNANETIADIIREMRDERIIRIEDADVTRCLLRNLADRLNAALAREAELADDDQFASHHLREAAKKVLPEAVLEVLRAFHDAHYSVFPRDELTERLCHAYHDQFVADAPACNAAAMREALNQLRDWALLDINENAIRSDEPNYKKLVDGIIEITNAALSAPARNCDVGTADEQADRFKAFCHSNRTPGNECSKECPFDDTSAVCYCQARWAQMLFAKAEGGAE